MERAETVFDPSLLEAWAAASRIVASAGGAPYVMTVSSGVGWNPTTADLQRIDKLADDAEFERPSTVASMLLPHVVQAGAGDPAAAIENGLRLLGRGRRKGLRFSGWSHTYFERLVGAWYDRRGTRRTIKGNRLLQAIDKLNQWDRNAEAALYLHTDLPTDTFRPRGSPCLQYVQLRAYGVKRLQLVALYRSHDYGNKFLGNALGLDLLGKFVASASGRAFDGMTIVSINPFCSQKGRLVGFVDAVVG